MALFTLGILLFLLIAADIIKTTLSPRGGGMLTNAVTRSVWALFFRAAGRQGRSGLLQYAGQFVVLLVLLSWILGLWASLFLLFASHPGSIVDDATKLPADLWEPSTTPVSPFQRWASATTPQPRTAGVC